MADAAEAISVTIQDDYDSVRYDPDAKILQTDTPDGGVVVEFGVRQQAEDEEGEDDFYRNLADDIDPATLTTIALDVVDGVKADDSSRKEHLQNIAAGIKLLGIKLESPKGTVGDSTSGVDGISSVTNPLLLDACLRGWAGAVGELLPATGPMKIRNDGNISKQADEQAERLERDMNHYLTEGAPEYYPDTSQMLLWGVYFGGCGIKKVYRCPMRRRPVSDSIPIEDFIVSDTTKDLGACGRITHVITMRPSVMKRMMHIGAYRDVPLTQPSSDTNPVKTQVAGVQGTTAQVQRPEDQPYTLYEVQCEIDIPEFAPEQFADESIPLPYIMTIDKDTMQVLAIRRDWEEDDEDCLRRKMYVKYPYVPGPGFYGTGLLNILGNSSAAMTAAWRESLDAGMYANFPGGVIAKLGGRQNTTRFTLSPGEFIPIETGDKSIKEVIDALPYRDVTPGLLNLMDKIIAQSKPLGGAAEIPSAEGLQNVPVGTMLAQIEQATKVISAAHKGMHTAQSEEFDLIIELFRQNPEDFWRNNKSAKKDQYWDRAKFIEALDNHKLVPCADPNVPSHIHRVGKAVALAQLFTIPQFAPLLDPQEALSRILAAMREDATGLLIQPAPQQPSLIEQSYMKTAEAKQASNVVKAQDTQVKAAAKAGEMMARERIEAAKNATKENVEAMKTLQSVVKDKEELSDSRQQAAHDRAMQMADRSFEREKFQHTSTVDEVKAAADLLKTQSDGNNPTQ